MLVIGYQSAEIIHQLFDNQRQHENEPSANDMILAPITKPKTVTVHLVDRQINWRNL